ncbi:MAG: hypothetical protein IJ298_01345 [Ruminococcus sp.]|nr:hypothetical protein [Ruminococcus sp.]
MATCTFFGHRDTPEKIEPTLRSALIDLIENKNVTLFYVGNNGNFDCMVTKQLRQLKETYPFISFYVVISYIPTKSLFDNNDIYETLYPEELEHTPLRFAIDKRNHWMLNNSDYVITYVTHITGGACKFKQIAEKKKKIIIELSDTEKPM